MAIIGNLSAPRGLHLENRKQRKSISITGNFVGTGEIASRIAGTGGFLFLQVKAGRKGGWSRS
jgi:hypothetical protein